MNSCAPSTCGPNPCGNITIVQAMSGSFYVDLFFQDTGEPFDLTSVTEIVAAFPATVNPGPSILEKLSLSQVAIIGAPGAGKIQVNYSALDSSNMQINPDTQQFQDLQVVVTKSGVAQIDTLSLASPVAGTAYSVTLNGLLFSYTAIAGDTSLVVFTALQAAMLQSTIANGTYTAIVSAVVSGSGNSATLILTSLFPGLGFSDIVANLTLVNSTANAGTRSTFILQATLNILPASYQGS